MNAFGEMVPRMAAAGLIGAALALRPWRLALRKPLPPTEMIHAQILLCAAAAVITAVIGDSMAKAFGLVGLGSFVRFRSGLKDPRDAAILFLVIGLGMACGHGSLGLAFAGTGFVAALLTGHWLAAPFAGLFCAGYTYVAVLVTREQFVGRLAAAQPAAESSAAGEMARAA